MFYDMSVVDGILVFCDVAYVFVVVGGQQSLMDTAYYKV